MLRNNFNVIGVLQNPFALSWRKRHPIVCWYLIFPYKSDCNHMAILRRQFTFYILYRRNYLCLMKLLKAFF
ncbi:hypothetical protein, partial [Rhizobium leguminosarum]|uniref:hypothetical protein n=1 Tax=Rhizobium leguminosarum TaxID=384 RepID=UPI003F99BBE8